MGHFECGSEAASGFWGVQRPGVQVGREGQGALPATLPCLTDMTPADETPLECSCSHAVTAAETRKYARLLRRHDIEILHSILPERSYHAKQVALALIPDLSCHHMHAAVAMVLFGL